MRDNILFMLGLKKERPKFDRYMYLEKFDYWAVFWGIVMMVGTGFIFWFPAFFASLGAVAGSSPRRSSSTARRRRSRSSSSSSSTSTTCT